MMYEYQVNFKLLILPNVRLSIPFHTFGLCFIHVSP